MARIALDGRPVSAVIATPWLTVLCRARPEWIAKALMIAFILGMLAGVFGYRQFVALSNLASPVQPQPPLTTGRGP